MRLVTALCALALVATPALADTYFDATGDLYNGSDPNFPTDFSGFTHLDIQEVEVTNDATHISFDITLVGDIIASDWGKYCIMMDSVPGGDTASNGWGRPWGMPAGADYYIGSWVDSGGGAETYSWDGGAWVRDNATWSPPSDIDFPVIQQYTVTLRTTLASLGLSIGDTFDFDVITTAGGGGDGAVDSLYNPNPNIKAWGEYSEIFGQAYTVIPEPASLLGLLVLGLLRRR